ncbi:MAG: hypothetical protein SFU56_03375 [Capsulimonadales bacterium]|nr:hypothetical protein [Capsulimonadales bacterium]
MGMNPALQMSLKAAGWWSGLRRGSLATRRAGIEFEVSEERGAGGRTELRYRYRTETTLAEGDVSLPADATRAMVEDAMTQIYLRVHERPDPTRVFGGGRSSHAERRAERHAAPNDASTAQTQSVPSDSPQGVLDF